MESVDIGQYKDLSKDKPKEKIFLKANKGIIGLKAEFTDNVLTKIGFIFKQVINVQFELLEVKEITEERTRILDMKLIKLKDSNVLMKDANVLLVEEDSPVGGGMRNIMINYPGTFSQNLELGVEY